MAGVTLDFGVGWSADGIYLQLADDPLYLALFQQDITPAVTDTDSTYTGTGVEADFPGYARILLDTWTVGAVTAHIASVYELLRVFIATGTSANQIYGYFLINGDDHVTHAERDPGAPIDLTYTGAVYAVVPTLKDKNP